MALRVCGPGEHVDGGLLGGDSESCCSKEGLESRKRFLSTSICTIIHPCISPCLPRSPFLPLFHAIASGRECVWHREEGELALNTTGPVQIGLEVTREMLLHM